MHVSLGVALFILAVGMTGAAVLHLATSESVGKRVAVLWCIALALCWGAWYVVAGLR